MSDYSFLYHYNASIIIWIDSNSTFSPPLLPAALSVPTGIWSARVGVKWEKRDQEGWKKKGATSVSTPFFLISLACIFLLIFLVRLFPPCSKSWAWREIFSFLRKSGGKFFLCKNWLVSRNKKFRSCHSSHIILFLYINIYSRAEPIIKIKTKINWTSKLCWPTTFIFKCWLLLQVNLFCFQLTPGLLPSVRDNLFFKCPLRYLAIIALYLKRRRLHLRRRMQPIEPCVRSRKWGRSAAEQRAAKLRAKEEEEEEKKKKTTNRRNKRRYSTEARYYFYHGVNINVFK